MDIQSNSPLTHTWKEQIRQVAACNPRLARQLWQNRQLYFDRFVHFYRQLANLPRKFRRKFLKRLATTLTGAALLLALGQALPARAATITVDGVTCTLAEAITSANNDNAGGNGCVDGSGADVIDLQTEVTLSALLPNISTEITLEGNGHTISGNNAFQVLNVQATSDLTLNDAIIAGGYVFNDNGGGIVNNGVLVVNNSTISGNSAITDDYGVFGGGIYNNGTLTVNNSTLSNNISGGYGGSGGGIFNTNNSILTVNGSTFSSNSAFEDGGGIKNYGGSVTLDNCTLSGNSASTGGGIYNIGTLTVNDSTLISNSASGSGGGIHNNSGTLTVNNSTLNGNSAIYGFGGGISNPSNGGTVAVHNSTMNGNSAGGLGGAGIFNSFGVVIVSNSALTNNLATKGGAINNIGGPMTVNNSTISGNIASSGGGINTIGSFILPASLTLNNSTITGNFASGSGGGIYNSLGSGYSSVVNLNRSLISGNAASNGEEVKNLGMVNANNYNVVGYSGSARSSGFVPGLHDIIPFGVIGTVLDIILADNGGPTLTHALVSGSLAIDTAPSVDCLAPPINGIDQRNYFRNVDGDGVLSSNECDAGSFEYGSEIAPTLTPTSSPTVTSTPTSTINPRMTETTRPTRTPTPRPTRTTTPTLVAVQENVLVSPPQEQSANPLVRMVVVTLLAVGNLLFFRNRKA